MKYVGEQFAQDWFTIAPDHRTKEQLAKHINRAIRAQIEHNQIYHVWKEMWSRCSDENNPHYHNYGGRGIKVCDRWKDFDLFLSDMGPRDLDNRLLERVDNNCGYNPSNCKWATRKEQNSNRRNCIYVKYKGERLTLKEVCRRMNIPYRPMVKRIRYRGWDVERALTTPLDMRRVKKCA